MKKLGWGGMNWVIEIDILIYTLLIICVKQITNENLLHYSMLCSDRDGKETQKRGDICMWMADSLLSTAETHDKVKQLHCNKN